MCTVTPEDYFTETVNLTVIQKDSQGFKPKTFLLQSRPQVQYKYWKSTSAQKLQCTATYDPALELRTSLKIFIFGKYRFWLLPGKSWYIGLYHCTIKYKFQQKELFSIVYQAIFIIQLKFSSRKIWMICSVCCDALQFPIKIFVFYFSIIPAADYSYGSHRGWAGASYPSHQTASSSQGHFIERWALFWFFLLLLLQLY